MKYVKNISEIITRGARVYGRRIAYFHDGATLDFKRLARDADCLAHQLRLSGVEKGEPVAVVLNK